MSTARYLRAVGLALGSLLLLAPRPAPAADPPGTREAAPAPRVERLAEVGRLWGAVRYLHPYLAYRDLDWDGALLAALPRAAAAGSRAEYRSAVADMLAALGDPVTHLLDDGEAAAPAAPPPSPEPGSSSPLSRRLDDGTLVVDLSDVVRRTSHELWGGLWQLESQVAGASAVIVDLRTGGSGDGDFGRELTALAIDQLAGKLASRPCRAPTQRYVLRSGFRAQDGSSSGDYSSGFLTLEAERFFPPPETPASGRRVVFLVDAHSRIPRVALALQAAGDGRIVSEGPLREDSVVATREVPAGEGLVAQLRVSELLPMPGWPGVHADVEVPAEGGGAGGEDRALAAARTALAGGGWGAAGRGGSPAEPLPEPVFRPDPTYPDMVAPDLAHRQLAVIRAWNVIHWFYPYLDLIGDWDAVLPEYLERMETANAAPDYALTLAAMMTHVPDGHTGVASPELRRYFGEATPALAVDWVEGRPVVTAVGEEARAAGVSPGDAVVAVDGEAVADRIARLRRYVTASTESALLGKLARLYLLLGPKGSTDLRIEGADGRVRAVRLTRDAEGRLFSMLQGRSTKPPSLGEVVRILPGNLGYANLTRLERSQVDEMFQRLAGTRGLIFDMRGYPHGTAWAITPRINTRGAEVGARFRRAQVSAFSPEKGQAGFFFSQPLPPLPAGASIYTGPTVMLIDDRTISQAEHTGLFFEAASGTKFVGTPSAGANGDVTSFTLPGGITVTFTGHDVRHADGRRLQRLGLQPDVTVAPTRAGIRRGEDEVLGRAVQYLDGLLTKPAVSSGDRGRSGRSGPGGAADPEKDRPQPAAAAAGVRRSPAATRARSQRQ